MLPLREHGQTTWKIACDAHAKDYQDYWYHLHGRIRCQQKNIQNKGNDDIIIKLCIVVVVMFVYDHTPTQTPLLSSTPTFYNINPYYKSLGVDPRSFIALCHDLFFLTLGIMYACIFYLIIVGHWMGTIYMDVWTCVLRSEKLSSVVTTLHFCGVVDCSVIRWDRLEWKIMNSLSWSWKEHVKRLKIINWDHREYL